MKPKLLILYLLLTLLPILMLAWIGIRLINSETAQVQDSLTKLYISKLKDYDVTVQKVLGARSRRIQDLSVAVTPGFQATEMRQKTTKESMIKQLFVLDAQGRLEFPVASMPLSREEQRFLGRTERIWADGLIPVGQLKQDAVMQKMRTPNNEPEQQQGKLLKQTVNKIQWSPPQRHTAPPAAPSTNSIATSGESATDGGWITWYWESGVHLLYWVRLDDGRVLGAEFDRASLMADMISELPMTDPFQKVGPDERVALVNASDSVVYQWGRFEPPKGVQPATELSLSAPLSSWTFAYYPGASISTTELTRSNLFTLILTLVSLGLVFLLLVIYFFREHSRDLNEAATRVSFVNRVSHELKTPLTNIRMYAELLTPHIDETDTKAQERLGVITEETERLSRLIANVLTFSKHDRDTLAICRKAVSIDAVIQAVIDRFDLSFKAAGIRVETSLAAETSVHVDSDALEQILINLFSNIEKYAAGGGRATLATSLAGDIATIVVSDNGPGIPAKSADHIFRPFYRLTDSLNEGVSGTGIGLGIARELARLHGGDLCLMPGDSNAGASFVITLNVSDG